MIENRQKICIKCGETLGEIVEEGQAFRVGRAFFYRPTPVWCACGKLWKWSPRDIFKTEETETNLSVRQALHGKENRI